MDTVAWIILIALLIGLWFIGASCVNVLKEAIRGVKHLIYWLFHQGS